jgi:hypothetical protein
MFRIASKYYVAILIAAALIFSTNNALAQSVVVDAFNESGSSSGGTWSAYTYGIEYTPTSSYLVTRIEANWGGGNTPQTITVEVFDGNPNLGGVKLTEGSFSQTAAGWQGADLNTPVVFSAGEDYFIGFGNTTGAMGQTYDVGVGIDTFTVWWGGSVGVYDVEDDYPVYNDPIWRFIGNDVSSTPVPGSSILSLLMLILLLAGTAVYAIRRTT